MIHAKRGKISRYIYEKICGISLLTADSKTAMYVSIIYTFVGLLGLLLVLIVSFACYKIFKRYVASNYKQTSGRKNIKKSRMESNEILDFLCNFYMLIC